jgi:hypothetical protein
MKQQKTVNAWALISGKHVLAQTNEKTAKEQFEMVKEYKEFKLKKCKITYSV